jgi:hypothetical protein
VHGLRKAEDIFKLMGHGGRIWPRPGRNGDETNIEIHRLREAA